MAAAASLGVNTVLAGVVEELLTKYKFIRTSEAADANHRNGHSFNWEEKDPPFRQLPVECSGFAENGGNVYVCGEILSMLSEDLKLKIERNQRIKFDCSKESFNTVMTFAHSTNGPRPTKEFLLQLLPMLHECQLSCSSGLCTLAIASIGPQYALTDLLMTAFRAENEVLLEVCLRSIKSRRTLLYVMDTCNAFRGVRKTCFAGEALGKMMELLKTLPENAAAPSVEDPGNSGYRLVNDGRFQKPQLPRFTEPSQTRGFPLTVGKETLYVSPPALAQASRFFHQLFYGDFTEQGLASLAVENATVGELKILLSLVLPTAWGMFWRLTPISCDQVSFASMYKSAFQSDPLKFVNVFKLAEYYQITGLVDYLTDIAVHCLPWRQRLQLADLFKSRELMASLLTDDSLKELKREMAVSANALYEFGAPTHQLLIEFFLHASNF